MTLRDGLYTALIACLRPALTLLCVTLPRWWALAHEPLPLVMPPHWRARQVYEDGKRGEGL